MSNPIHNNKIQMIDHIKGLVDNAIAHGMDLKELVHHLQTKQLKKIPPIDHWSDFQSDLTQIGLTQIVENRSQTKIEVVGYYKNLDIPFFIDFCNKQSKLYISITMYDKAYRRNVNKKIAHNLNHLATLLPLCYFEYFETDWNNKFLNLSDILNQFIHDYDQTKLNKVESAEFLLYRS